MQSAHKYRDRLAAAWERLGLTAQVITLSSRPDRAEHVQSAAGSVSLPYELFQVERHPSGGTQGCFESHVALCRRALERGQRMMLVLEDDFEPTLDVLGTEAGVRALEELVDFVSTRIEWDLMYLGVMPNIWTEKSTRTGRQLYRLHPWACTHAYVINTDYMHEVAGWTFKQSGHDAIDWRYRECRRAYACHPQVFKQYESPSDIRSVQLPVPAFLRDVPVNAASWYALNVGASLSQTLLVLSVGAVMLSLRRSSAAQNGMLARHALARTTARWRAAA